MIPILLLTLCLSEPNDSAWTILVSHWLDVKAVESKEFDPNVPVKHTFTVWPCSCSKDDYLIIRPRDPNDTLQVTSVHKVRMDYEDFAIYARQYRGDPNYTPPTEPNKPEDPNLYDLLPGITDPNFAAAVKIMMESK